jgi:hypothetical protein
LDAPSGIGSGRLEDFSYSLQIRPRWKSIFPIRNFQAGEPEIKIPYSRRIKDFARGGRRKRMHFVREKRYKPSRPALSSGKRLSEKRDKREKT